MLQNRRKNAVSTRYAKNKNEDPYPGKSPQERTYIGKPGKREQRNADLLYELPPRSLTSFGEPSEQPVMRTSQQTVTVESSQNASSLRQLVRVPTDDLIRISD